MINAANHEPHLLYGVGLFDEAGDSLTISLLHETAQDNTLSIIVETRAPV